MIDTKTVKEIKRIPVGSRAIGIEFSPDQKKAFVGWEKGDGLHVIDLEKMEVEAVIHPGSGPDPMMLWYPPKG